MEIIAAISGQSVLKMNSRRYTDKAYDEFMRQLQASGLPLWLSVSPEPIEPLKVVPVPDDVCAELDGWFKTAPEMKKLPK